MAMPASDRPHFSSSVIRARPRSASLTPPSLVRMTFSGLTSRWIRPRACACFSASATASDDAEGFLLVERLVLVEVVLDRVSFDVLHDEEVVAVDLAGIDRIDDVIVRQPRGDLGLALEPLDEFLVLGQGIEQDLDGDDAVDAHLLGLVDHAHRALADLLDHLIAGDLELLRRSRRPPGGDGPSGSGEDLGLDHDLQQALRDLLLLGRRSACACVLQASISAAVARPRRMIDFSSCDSSRPGEPAWILAGCTALDRSGHEAVSPMPPRCGETIGGRSYPETGPVAAPGRSRPSAKRDHLGAGLGPSKLGLQRSDCQRKSLCRVRSRRSGE